MSILVTGSSGSIGHALVRELNRRGDFVLKFDLADGRWNVLDPVSLMIAMQQGDDEGDRVTHVFHLAGAKHATIGEEDPIGAVQTNVIGTHNVVEVAAHHDAQVILASTCKAAQPETVYGASKLAAERIVLNAGGSVARLYNVSESSGNVLRIWEALPADAPIPVTPCKRTFITRDEAVWLFIQIMGMPPGRYASSRGMHISMRDLAQLEYPDRERVEMEPRRGDRIVEPQLGDHEVKSMPRPGIMQIHNPHDAVIEEREENAA